ncbi:ER degradation-enhancing alpha-mannosidase-like protein 1 [Golovinomyces cichoracearum]|uniref:alpha-1,2-Mannosidase n=1 Tax=Golovinomyces cichoracearum TaxID=62708 RepID=A0A420HF37_9PEZI|nr:ER degradation-enhancing alpha-mannosidase-like protein 1 [Golovinomyces cichoracearum]
MRLRWQFLLSSSRLKDKQVSRCGISVIYAVWLVAASAMSTERIARLRQETIEMFYHGFDNYMNVAFPEDEIRPVTCVPLTRDQHNPHNVELNDVLGNYSLTLIDSLSSLAILASSPADESATGDRALQDFQNGVASLVLNYGDGTRGPEGEGLRAHGFNIDSKVQVFETVIRGVGGLLSAHLFAVGELPISRYHPEPVKASSTHNTTGNDGKFEIKWSNGLTYNGQLLRLALDLGERLLPAFYTSTGIPYPRVNLRHGIPFYLNSPLHKFPKKVLDGPEEITETCSAGAGSLVLEFTVLSRLTNDMRFEQLAKRAFWAVWNKRSSIGLLGSGIDAENGQWIGAYSGIGAGTDSFLEYALKTHILLSGREISNYTVRQMDGLDSRLDPNTLHCPLTAEENSSAAFLDAWHEAHAAVKRHLYVKTHHPHYINVHLSTGSPQAYWIDSLSAYYPGLLAMAGEIEEAIETHLLYTALWTKYSALPERWSVRDGQVEGSLGWWPGRPEFIESNYHIYQATRDPWYLHVGEMVLNDIKRRCHTRCGWSGLQDVRTGEKSDRMESFFLGETAKYLYLLFDPDHPLNSLDASYVFTTEGHPLLIPVAGKSTNMIPKSPTPVVTRDLKNKKLRSTCPISPSPIPLTVSVTAARRDLFHASSLIGLNFLPKHHHVGESDLAQSDSTLISSHETLNYTIYPWTLPKSLIPVKGMCDLLPLKNTFTIEFPASSTLQKTDDSNFVVFGTQNLLRVPRGILVKSLSGIRLGLVRDTLSSSMADDSSTESWRVWDISNIPLGRDEQIFISRDVVGEMVDPSFTRIRDPLMLDLVVQLDSDLNNSSSEMNKQHSENGKKMGSDYDLTNPGLASEYKVLISSFLHSFTSILSSPAPTPTEKIKSQQNYHTTLLPAILPTGIGAAPVPDVPDAPGLDRTHQNSKLSWTTFSFVGDGCGGKIEDTVPVNHHVIVIRRGGCSFSQKLSNIPSFAPTSKSLQLVIIVSGEADEHGDEFDSIYNENGEGTGWTKNHQMIRPLLDKVQVTPSGLMRHNQVAMVMISGGLEVENLLRRARSLGFRRRYYVESQGDIVTNIVLD